MLKSAKELYAGLSSSPIFVLHLAPRRKGTLVLLVAGCAAVALAAHKVLRRSFSKVQDSTAQKQTPASEKLDKAGNFLPYPGVTVISALSPDASLHQLPGILRGLTDDASGLHFAILPPSSYHVTVLDIACQHKLGLSGEEWVKYLSGPRWTNAAALLQKTSFAPKLRFKGVGDWLNGVNLEFECENGDAASELTASLRQALDLPYKEPWPFHLTLAYRVGSKRVEPARFHEFARELDARIRPLLQEQVLLPLEAAQLCMFDDMTAFVNWDGRLP